MDTVKKIIGEISKFKRPFIFEELYNKVSDTIDKIKLKRYLDRLCKNGLLIKHGSFYSIKDHIM